MIECVFFDRDGTLGTLSDVRYPQTFTCFPDAKSTVAALKKRGYKVMIATNQACIARGTDGGYDYAAEFQDLGADDWFICPHDSADRCDCRKPAVGLLLRAIQKHNLKAENCVMVGDRSTDIICGQKMGMFTVLLDSERKCQCSPLPDAVISSLAELLQILE